MPNDTTTELNKELDLTATLGCVSSPKRIRNLLRLFAIVALKKKTRWYVWLTSDLLPLLKASVSLFSTFLILKQARKLQARLV